MRRKIGDCNSLVILTVVGLFLQMLLPSRTTLAAQPFSQDHRLDLKVFSGRECYPDNLVAADLNGDGRIDLAVTGFCKGFAIFLADNTQPPQAGRFLPPREVRLPDSAIGMAVIPRKNKANPFIVVSNCSNPDTQSRPPILQIVSMESLKVIKTLPTGGKAPDDIAVADFNGDGFQDMVVGHWMQGTLSLLLGREEEASFQIPAALSPQRVSVGDEHWQIVPADFNKDGNLDVAFLVWTFKRDGSRVAAVDILFGDGKGGFDSSSLKTYPVDMEARSLAVADLNGDGNLDIAVANPGSGLKEDGSVLLLFGDGKGEFTPKLLTASDLGGGLLAPQGIVAADFDGDGKPDLAVASRPVSQEGRISILHNEGEGRFSLTNGQVLLLGPRSKVSNLSFRPLIAADLNGDGTPDLAVTNQELNTITIFFNNSQRPAKTANR